MIDSCYRLVVTFGGEMLPNGLVTGWFRKDYLYVTHHGEYGKLRNWDGANFSGYRRLLAGNCFCLL